MNHFQKQLEVQFQLEIGEKTSKEMSLKLAFLRF
jgi:hypothetical protein